MSSWSRFEHFTIYATVNHLICVLYAGTWNFHEAGHGKGAPDGVGATVKRMADSLVLRGADCPDAKSMMRLLQTANCDIQLYLIPSQDIDRGIMEASQFSLPSVPGTMRMHQLVFKSATTFSYRELSCCCKKGQLCLCFNPKDFTMPLQAASHQRSSPKRTKSEADRQEYFATHLTKIQDCTHFKQLKAICKKLEIEMETKFTIQGHQANMMPTMEVDVDASVNMPDDLPDGVSGLLPIQVRADGDCLPHTGSVLAFGHEEAAQELRVRIIVELVVHDDLYLDHTFVNRGTIVSKRNARNILNNYTMYSGQYEVDRRITRRDIVFTYQSEALEMATSSVYMGIWQILAMSSVLGARLFSVYPKRGNPSVRNDLHRLIVPRITKTDEIFYLMWTSTRYAEMTGDHFVPNHFVPLLMPLEKHKTAFLPGNSNKGPTVVNTQPEAYGGGSLVDKYVVVRYDNAPYPGIVIDEDHEALEVKCMNRIGENRFYWPSRVDTCWYSKDDIITFAIPSPVKVTDRHMQIQPSIWQNVLKNL